MATATAFGSFGSLAQASCSQASNSAIGSVSDSSGGIHNPAGLDLDAVTDAKRAAGSVSGHRDGDKVTQDELLTLDCDVLVPAALEGALDVAAAEQCKAALIAEAAMPSMTTDRIRKAE